MKDPDAKGKQGAGPDSASAIRVTDRRHRFDEEGAPAPDPSEPAPRHPSLVNELKARALAAESKLGEALNLLRKREAEADDFRARLRREMERRSRNELEGWLKELLDVLDSLDRGISAADPNGPSVLLDGLVKIRDQFLSILSRRGVHSMALTGTIYDPHLAEAVAVSPAATPEDDSKVLEELRPGYWLGDQVLRPAQVRVARSTAAVSDPDSPKTPPVEA
jgi:molecular chaperone GrpE